MIDIDHFKRFNDLLGHDAGDKVLAELGSFIRKHIRKGDVPCRLGGEEFAILLPKTDAPTALARAEDLRKGIEGMKVEHRGQDLGKVTVSCGVAAFPTHAEDTAELFRAADQALYNSKANGRNRVTMAKPRFEIQHVSQTAEAG